MRSFILNIILFRLNFSKIKWTINQNQNRNLRKERSKKKKMQKEVDLEKEASHLEKEANQDLEVIVTLVEEIIVENQ